MTKEEVIGLLEDARAYWKANKKFFKKFFFYYRIVNSRISNILKSAAVVLVILSILVLALGVVGVIPPFDGKLFVGALIAFLVAVIVGGPLSLLEEKQDAMYEQYSVVELVGEMLRCMCGLDYVFWNRRDIKKLIKRMSADGVEKLQVVALHTKPKSKNLMFDVERFNEISANAVERQNKRIEKRNKKAAKEEKRQQRSTLFWGALAEIAFSDAGGGKIESPSAMVSSGQRSVPVQTNDSSKAEEERKRQLAEYARQADWWEQEYRRLYAWDPNHYKTKDAEYNKNYFRRLSRGGS